MERRLEIVRQILCDILENENVYLEPPTHLNYPCIILERQREDIRYADNKRYFRGIPYSLMLIDQDVATKIPDKLFEANDLPYLSEDRSPYITDGLIHFVYTIYI